MFLINILPTKFLFKSLRGQKIIYFSDHISNSASKMKFYSAILVLPLAIQALAFPITVEKRGSVSNSGEGSDDKVDSSTRNINVSKEGMTISIQAGDGKPDVAKINKRLTGSSASATDERSSNVKSQKKHFKVKRNQMVSAKKGNKKKSNKKKRDQKKSIKKRGAQKSAIKKRETVKRQKKKD